MDRMQQYNNMRKKIKEISEIPPDLELTDEEMRQRNQLRSQKNNKILFSARLRMVSSQNFKEKQVIIHQNIPKGPQSSKKMTIFDNKFIKKTLFQPPKQIKVENKQQVPLIITANQKTSLQPQGQTKNQTINSKVDHHQIFTVGPSSQNLQIRTTTLMFSNQKIQARQMVIIQNIPKGPQAPKKMTIFDNKFTKKNLFQPSKQIKAENKQQVPLIITANQKTLQQPEGQKQKSLFNSKVDHPQSIFGSLGSQKVQIRRDNMFGNQLFKVKQKPQGNVKNELFSSKVDHHQSIFAVTSSQKVQIRPANMFFNQFFKEKQVLINQNAPKEPQATKQMTIFDNNSSKKNLFQPSKQIKAEIKQIPLIFTANQKTSQQPQGQTQKSLFSFKVDHPQSIFGGLGNQKVQNRPANMFVNEFFKEKEKPQVQKKNELSNSKAEHQQSFIVGPGGKKLQIRTTNMMFSNQKPPPIVSNNIPQKSKASDNIFTNQSKFQNLFNTNNIGGQPSPFGQSLIKNQNQANLFTQQSTTAVNFFGAPIITTVPATQGLFSNMQSTLFSKNGNADNSQSQNEQGDDLPIEADIDENLIKAEPTFNYLKTNIIFKELAMKFRIGFKDTLQNISVSIEKFDNSEDYYIYGRMSNKCITFCGKILPNMTEFRVLNNSKENIEITKLLLTGQSVKKMQIVMIKIKFKDSSLGFKLIKELQKCIKKVIPQ